MAVQYATEDDWKLHRDTISRLYLEENRPLKEVMAIMEHDYQLKATIKMYKARFSSWGLSKKFKESDVRTIARIKVIRASLGKPSEFRVYGRSVDNQKVEAYMKRKGLQLMDIIRSQALPAASSSNIECLTPPASPSPPPRLSADLLIPETIFYSISNYFMGSFGAGTWISSSPTVDCVSIREGGNEMLGLKRLFSQHDVACSLFDRGNFEEGGLALINASAGVKDILLAEHPRTLGGLFDLLIFLEGRGRREIAKILLLQFAGLATVILGEKHPVTIVCKRLTEVEDDILIEIIVRAWSNALDNLDTMLGRMHYSALRSRLEYIQMAEGRHGLGIAEEMLRKLVAECRASCGWGDVRSLKLLDTLGELLINQGKHSAAEEVAWTIINDSADVTPRAKHVDIRVAGLYILARVQAHWARNAEAEANMWWAIELNVSEYGWQHALTLKYTMQLEDWYCAWGLAEKAAEMKELRKGSWENGLVD